MSITRHSAYLLYQPESKRYRICPWERAGCLAQKGTISKTDDLGLWHSSQALSGHGFMVVKVSSSENFLLCFPLLLCVILLEESVHLYQSRVFFSCFWYPSSFFTHFLLLGQTFITCYLVYQKCIIIDFPDSSLCIFICDNLSAIRVPLRNTMIILLCLFPASLRALYCQ